MAGMNQTPQLQHPLPGPRTAALIARDEAVISPSYTRGYPLSIAKGEGPWVIDCDGNRFLDFCAGIAVCATGHSHPRVVEAISGQAQQFIHMSGTDFYYAPMVDLAERLAASAPGGGGRRVFFGNSGAEAIEGALKLARYHTGRQAIISFFGGFHGRTYGAMSVTGRKAQQRARFAPLVPGIFHAHYPNVSKNPFGTTTPDATAQACLDYIENTLFKSVIPANEVAAFLLEPIQGEGGYIVPPDSFLTGLQALAQQHGILVIADEVQAGVGRTGRMWASDHVAGFAPDIMTSAKGLASGMPLGAVIARADVMSWAPGAHASTFGGNPVSCAAALATLDLLEEGLMANAASQGARLMQALEGLKTSHSRLVDIRGRGLMIGLELADANGKPVPALRDAVVDKAFAHGLLILGCGESGIRLSPPLVVDEGHCDLAVSILDKALAEAV